MEAPHPTVADLLVRIRALSERNTEIFRRIDEQESPMRSPIAWGGEPVELTDPFNDPLDLSHRSRTLEELSHLNRDLVRVANKYGFFDDSTKARSQVQLLLSNLQRIYEAIVPLCPSGDSQPPRFRLGRVVPLPAGRGGGIAVDCDSGHVLVSVDNKLHVFDADGNNLVRPINAGHVSLGSFAMYQGQLLATIENLPGRVQVFDIENDSLVPSDPSGAETIEDQVGEPPALRGFEPSRAETMAIDGEGNIFLCGQNQVQVVSQQGERSEPWEFVKPTQYAYCSRPIPNGSSGLAVAPNGHVFVSSRVGVHVYNREGQFKFWCADTTPWPNRQGACGGSIAVLSVPTEPSGPARTLALTATGDGRVGIFNADDGSFVDFLGSWFYDGEVPRFKRPHRLCVDERRRKVYVVDCSQLYIFAY